MVSRTLRIPIQFRYSLACYDRSASVYIRACRVYSVDAMRSLVPIVSFSGHFASGFIVTVCFLRFAGTLYQLPLGPFISVCSLESCESERYNL